MEKTWDAVSAAEDKHRWLVDVSMSVNGAIREPFFQFSQPPQFHLCPATAIELQLVHLPMRP